MNTNRRTPRTPTLAAGAETDVDATSFGTNTIWFLHEAEAPREAAATPARG
jgi:hypothetical protein